MNRLEMTVPVGWALNTNNYLVVGAVVVVVLSVAVVVVAEVILVYPPPPPPSYDEQPLCGSDVRLGGDCAFTESW